jgi:hypothetical protein
VPVSTMAFKEIRDAWGERYSAHENFSVHVRDAEGFGGVYFQTLNDLKKFVEAANSLIAREENVEAAGR